MVKSYFEIQELQAKHWDVKSWINSTRYGTDDLPPLHWAGALDWRTQNGNIADERKRRWKLLILSFEEISFFRMNLFPSSLQLVYSTQPKMASVWILLLHRVKSIALGDFSSLSPSTSPPILAIFIKAFVSNGIKKFSLRVALRTRVFSPIRFLGNQSNSKSRFYFQIRIPQSSSSSYHSYSESDHQSHFFYWRMSR